MQTQLRSTKIVLKLALWTMGQKVKLTLYFDSLLLSRVAQRHKIFWKKKQSYYWLLCITGYQIKQIKGFSKKLKQAK